MTTTSQAPLKLPPAFAASYWPSTPSFPSYRSAVVHLYSLLQQGIDEDTALLGFIRHLVETQWHLVETFRQSQAKSIAATNKSKPIFKGSRRDNDHGSASAARPSYLVNTIHAAVVEPVAATHVKTAQYLQRKILEPFEDWSEMHADRIRASWTNIETWLDNHEKGQDELDNLRQAYEAKCRQADEAEEDARFAGIDVEAALEADGAVDDSTRDLHSRTPSYDEGLRASLSSQLADSIREGASMSSEKTAVDSMTTSEAGDEDKMDPVALERRQTLRKQFGFSPRAERSKRDRQRTLSAEIPSPSKTPALSNSTEATPKQATLSSALSSALSGPSLQAFKDRIAAAAGTGGIAEKWRRLRRDAEKLENDYLRRARQLDTMRCRLEDALFENLTSLQRFELDRLAATKKVIRAYSEAFQGMHPSFAGRLQPLLQSHDPSRLLSQLIVSSRTGFYKPLPEIFLPFYHDESFSNPAIGHGTGWAGFGMSLNARWRHDVLSRHEVESSMDAIASPSKKSTSVSASPRPVASLPIVFSHLLSSLERAYGESSLWPVPAEAADASSTREAVNVEKRKTFIYDVPLKAAHACREAIVSHTLSDHPGAEHGAGLPALLDKFDPPTKAMTVKLWLSELQESVIPQDTWHMVSSLYKAAESVEAKWRTEMLEKRAVKGKTSEVGHTENGSATKPAVMAASTEPIVLDAEIKKEIERGVVEDLTVVLSKLSTVHLVVLDSLLLHLRSLVTGTPNGQETDDIYLNKLGLSIGRCLIRPPQTTQSTLASPVPVLLLIDLIKHYDRLVPPALERLSRHEEETLLAKRQMPTRKRTKPLDTRKRRSQASDLPALPRISTQLISEPAAISAIAGGGIAGTVGSPADGQNGLLQTKEKADEDDDAPTPVAERMIGTVRSNVERQYPAVAKESLDPSLPTMDQQRVTLTAPISPSGRSSLDSGAGADSSDYGTPTDEAPMSWQGGRSLDEKSSDKPTSGAGKVAEKVKEVKDAVKDAVKPASSSTAPATSATSGNSRARAYSTSPRPGSPLKTSTALASMGAGGASSRPSSPTKPLGQSYSRPYSPASSPSKANVSLPSTGSVGSPFTPRSGAGSSTATSNGEWDEDKPLSNVARLSRQFGSGSSSHSPVGGVASGTSRTAGSVGGVRGPRPAGARTGGAPGAAAGAVGAGGSVTPSSSGSLYKR